MRRKEPQVGAFEAAEGMADSAADEAFENFGDVAGSAAEAVPAGASEAAGGLGAAAAAGAAGAAALAAGAAYGAAEEADEPGEAASETEGPQQAEDGANEGKSLEELIEANAMSLINGGGEAGAEAPAAAAGGAAAAGTAAAGAAAAAAVKESGSAKTDKPAFKVPEGKFIPVARQSLDEMVEYAEKNGGEVATRRDEISGLDVVDYTSVL